MQVLVVDDDSLVLANAVALLEELGHEVVAAGSAQEALDLLRSRPRIQLMLTDHAMPHMTGAELVDAARREFPQLAVILASGYAELQSQMPAFVLRLTKPFGQAELSRAIALAIERTASPRP
jgi:CheY-like chemotaxis protein